MSDFEFIVIEKIVNESDNNIDRRLGGFLVLAIMYSSALWIEWQKIRI